MRGDAGTRGVASPMPAGPAADSTHRSPAVVDRTDKQLDN